MSQAESAQSEVERRLTAQSDKEREQKSLTKAFNQQGELDRGWMKEILDTEDLENYLDQYEIDKISGLLNRQWILANLSEAQAHDRWYKLEVMKYKIYGSFPPSESSIQGPIRAAVLDDKSETLTALTAEQRNVIDQIITSLQNMVTRSKDGFERKQMNTSIARAESETTETGEEKKRSRLSLFG